MVYRINNMNIILIILYTLTKKIKFVKFLNIKKIGSKLILVKNRYIKFKILIY